jgi:hypothetical protein
MPHQVHGVLLPIMSGSELSRVRQAAFPDSYAGIRIGRLAVLPSFGKLLSPCFCWLRC